MMEVNEAGLRYYSTKIKNTEKNIIEIVKNDLKDSTQNFFNPGQLSIRRACMGNAKFKISMYLEDSEPQVHNVVVDEFVVVWGQWVL